MKVPKFMIAIIKCVQYNILKWKISVIKIFVKTIKIMFYDYDSAIKIKYRVFDIKNNNV